MTEFEFLAELRKNVADPREVTSMDPTSLEFLNTFNITPLTKRFPYLLLFGNSVANHSPSRFIFGTRTKPTKLPFFHPGVSKILKAKIEPVFDNCRVQFRDSSPWTIVNNEIVDLPIEVYNYSVYNSGEKDEKLFSLACFTLNMFEKKGISNAFVNLVAPGPDAKNIYSARLVNKFQKPSNNLVCYSFLVMSERAIDAIDSSTIPDKLQVWKQGSVIVNIWISEEDFVNGYNVKIITPMYFELGGIPFLLNSLILKQMGLKLSNSGKVSILLKDKGSVCPEVNLSVSGMPIEICLLSFPEIYYVQKTLEEIWTAVWKCCEQGFDFSFLGLIFSEEKLIWVDAIDSDVNLPLQLELVKKVILQKQYKGQKFYPAESNPFRKKLAYKLENDPREHEFFEDIQKSIDETKVKRIFGRIKNKYTPEQIQGFIEKGKIEEILARPSFAEKLGLEL